MKKSVYILFIAFFASLLIPVQAGPQWTHHLELTKRFQQQRAEVRRQHEAAKPESAPIATGSKSAKPVK